ncbi:hypothetical protein N329_00926, partial [Haliaeetus albicilla]
EGLVQKVELQAVTEAFKLWLNVSINIICDSLYVVGVVQRMETAILKHYKQEDLYQQFRTLWYLLNDRLHTYFVSHVRSHMNLPGEIAQGNTTVDQLVPHAWTGPSPDKLGQARISHGFFHPSAKVFAKQFGITIGHAKAITQTCSECQLVGTNSPGAVNPRGLNSLQLWRMDVTHVPEFGKLKYVHVSVDCFSAAVWATAQTGETSRHVQRHLRLAFAAHGIPLQIKTDNGPCYIAQTTQKFFSQWGNIVHTMGIPHSPTGQAIVKRMNQILKCQLEKQ